MCATAVVTFIAALTAIAQTGSGTVQGRWAFRMYSTADATQPLPVETMPGPMTSRRETTASRRSLPFPTSGTSIYQANDELRPQGLLPAERHKQVISPYRHIFPRASVTVIELGVAHSMPVTVHNEQSRLIQPASAT